MARRISKRKISEREVKPVKERLKIFGKVLDDKVLDVIIGLLNSRAITSLDFPVSGGKEAIVFRASRKPLDGPVEYLAVKVFKYETSSFKHMLTYIEGDRKFDPRKNRRLLVNDWARKEYSNLCICHKAGIRVPQPLFYKKNVIVMEFIGVGGVQSARLEEVVLENPDETYREVLGLARKVYDAGLVHADLSSFNIIIHKGRPVIIDWAQGVEVSHPLANEFLKKDCRNLADFFSRSGVATSFDEVYSAITGKKAVV